MEVKKCQQFIKKPAAVSLCVNSTGIVATPRRLLPVNQQQHFTNAMQKALIDEPLPYITQFKSPTWATASKKSTLAVKVRSNSPCANRAQMLGSTMHIKQITPIQSQNLQKLEKLKQNNSDLKGVYDTMMKAKKSDLSINKLTSLASTANIKLDQRKNSLNLDKSEKLKNALTARKQSIIKSLQRTAVNL